MYPSETWRGKASWNGNLPKYLKCFQPWRSPTYEKLTQNDSEAIESLKNERSIKRWLVYLVGLTIVLVCLALLAIKYFVGSWSSGTHSMAVQSCGESPEEARSRGCIFEPMLSSWTHPLCYFKEVADLYVDKFEQWTWFRDPDMTDLISDTDELDRMRAGNYTVAFTNAVGSHIVHCLYTWRKLSFAMEQHRTWLDARTLASTHTSHCAAAVMDTVSSSDFVPLLRDQYFEEVPEWKLRNPNASVWPLLFHTCIPLQATLDRE